MKGVEWAHEVLVGEGVGAGSHLASCTNYLEYRSVGPRIHLESLIKQVTSLLLTHRLTCQIKSHKAPDDKCLGKCTVLAVWA